MSTDKRQRQRTNRAARAEAVEAAAARRRTVVTVAGVITVVVAVMVALAVAGGDPDPEPADTEPTDTEPTDTEPTDTEPTDTEPTDTEPTDTEPTDTGCPAEDGSSPRTIDFDGPHPMCIDVTESHVAVFATSEGEVRVALDSTNTPITTNNFVTLARWGYYDGTTLFRTDPSIDIIQGGSPHTESPSDPGPGYTIPDEPAFDVTADGQLIGPYRYEPGQLVMARTFAPDSASAQFFFSTGPNTALLDGQGVYVVFGRTDDAGLAVLQQIIGLHEPGGSLGGAPSRTVTVESVTIEVG